MSFELYSDYLPAGDQPQAIEKLVKERRNGSRLVLKEAKLCKPCDLFFFIEDFAQHLVDMHREARVVVVPEAATATATGGAATAEQAATPEPEIPG